MECVAIITPSRPDRGPLLVEACRSVVDQDYEPTAISHLLDLDHDGEGPAKLRNALARKATECGADWLGFLDDDDRLHPHHVSTLVRVGRETGADVVGSYCDFDGPPLPPIHCNRPFRWPELRRRGVFPITVLVRPATFWAAGGFGDERYEDWELWKRIYRNGGRIHIEPVVTWTYRTAHADRRTVTG
ncbi:MAG: glycosyltransferase family 2 protein [Ilumatobacteraceae bacterium]